MMHRTLVLFSTLAIAASTGIIFPKGSCTDDSATSKSCCTVDPETNAECHRHVQWAMGPGYSRHEKWYDLYGVKSTSDFADFQCSLFWISWNKAHMEREKGFASPHHSCPRPCSTTILDDCAEPPKSVDSTFDEATQMNFKKGPSFKIDSCPNVTAPTNCSCGTALEKVCPTTNPSCTLEAEKTCTESVCTKECPSSLSPLMIALIVLLALALLAAAVYFLCFGKKEKTKKKKRALKPAPQAAEPPAPPATAQPQSFTMAPMRTTAVIQGAPIYSGVVTTAPPTTASMMQPVQATAVPMVQYAAPAPQPMQYAVAQPQMMQYAVPAYQQGVSLFDALDTNHDGVISRSEFR